MVDYEVRVGVSNGSVNYWMEIGGNGRSSYYLELGFDDAFRRLCEDARREGRGVNLYIDGSNGRFPVRVINALRKSLGCNGKLEQRV